jgi:hypothetical protein
MAGLCEDTAEITVATTSKGSDNDPLLSSVLQVCCVVIGIVVQGGLVRRAESGADADGPCFSCFTSALHHLAETRGARLGADILRISDTSRTFSFVWSYHHMGDSCLELSENISINPFTSCCRREHESRLYMIPLVFSSRN